MRRYTRLIDHPVLHSFIWRQVLGSASSSITVSISLPHAFAMSEHVTRRFAMT